MYRLVQKILHFIKWTLIWSVIIGFISLILILAFWIYCARETGADLCAPGERVESTVTNSKGIQAEIHMCPDFLASHYYLETEPKGEFSEKRPRFYFEINPQDLPPTLEWINNNTLKVTLPSGMYHDDVSTYNGVHLLYVGGEAKK